MAASRETRSLRWGSLVAMVIFFAIAITILVVVPSSPVNRSHTTTTITPGAVTLPPTAAPPTATPTKTVAPTTTVNG